MTSAAICFPPLCPRRERPNIIPSRSVCRQLFGPVNHEQLKADLQSEKRKLLADNNEKWNFDFENGIPLVGRYRWQKVQFSLSSDNPNASLPDCPNETEANQRLICSNCSSSSSGTTTTTTTTTTSKFVKVSDDPNASEKETLLSESVRRDRAKLSRGMRKRKSSGKITGELYKFSCFQSSNFGFAIHFHKVQLRSRVHARKSDVYSSHFIISCFRKTGSF